MKRIFIIILVLILAVVAISIYQSNENLERTYRLGDSGITIKISNAYKKVKNEQENSLLYVYNEDKEISINAIKVKDDFWSSEDLENRIDEYIRVISAANYDASIKNVKTSIIEKDGKEIARTQFELEKKTGNQKVISLISKKENKNIIIEITGKIENIDKNIENIEKIIDSIKIKK